MTTPPGPPAPPAADPPAPPTPPVPPAPPAPPAPADPPKAPDDLAELRASLEAERKKTRKLEADLVKAQQQGMTEQEKALADARAEGKAEAAAEHARDLAAAEFRAQAAGKIANPDAALAVLDLAKLVKDGQPDKDAIGAVVAQLAAVPPPPGHVPAGPRQQPANGDGDWLRDQMRSTRR
jgi:hypothetical protein